MNQRFTSTQVLSRLKDFQRQTVEHVFRRLYLDDPPTRRFLVADEVGLGKTMVAKGVIARAIEYLQDTVERIDIVYVCSNSAIAQQNVARLNVIGGKDFALASRLTLLPTQVRGLRNNRVNFVSFTPGTTFDLKSRSGMMMERAVLFRMLQSEGWVNETGLLNALQGPAGRKSWAVCAHDWVFELDEDLADAFRNDLRSAPGFQKQVADVCSRFEIHRENVPHEDNQPRYVLIGELRQRLSRVCLHALQPDLIILDEFQRFRNLLRADDPTAELAQMLFNYGDARVLMLSATPYKMLSLDHEAEDDHYPDFLQTLGFLFNQPEAVAATEQEIQAFRRALLELDLEQPEKVTVARKALEKRLRSVMCRTERVAFTAHQDAMVSEPPRPALILPDDLRQAALIDAVSCRVGARDGIEFWKSTPYALNFMKDYELRRNMEKLDAEALAEVVGIIEKHTKQLLASAPIERYEESQPANAKLRSLFSDTLDAGLWRVLWLPPSLPAWQPSGPFLGQANATKALVFSAWNAVPNAIAALTSYEAERRMIAGLGRDDITYGALHDKVKPLLRFSRDAEGRLTGMPALLLQYPSASLAALVDPVDLALEVCEANLPRLEEILLVVEERVERLLQPLIATAPLQGREDERWYWAAVALMDARAYPGLVRWCMQFNGWRELHAGRDSEQSVAFSEHLKLMAIAFSGQLVPVLGRPPADLFSVLAELTLAGPGVCSLRSLRRVAPALAWDDPRILNAVVKMAEGFRSLFNLPESIALLRGTDEVHSSYWRSTLRHGLEGNLPALLDEQVHVLSESLGLADASESTRVERIAQELADSLSIRTSLLGVDELMPQPSTGMIAIKPFKLRCRFALRFGEMRDEKSEVRIETVRSAFNSPFRPFVLASTSVGQEGLDFHNWCHSIVHWNLPSNPVDLEQREGRVHRYKNHAVRKNVAQSLGLEALRGRWKAGDDPWSILFSTAREVRSGDLLTYWLFEFEGGATIERRVPLLPLSRDSEQLNRLKRGLALYRLVFGQPRQEDLLTHLSEHLPTKEIDRVVKEWRIDLTPPLAVRAEAS